MQCVWREWGPRVNRAAVQASHELLVRCAMSSVRPPNGLWSSL